MKRNPVLLIHGLFDRINIFEQITYDLTLLGWEVHRFSLKPNNARLGIDQLAHQIANYIESNFDSNQPIDLIGLSMGGLVSRYYIQRLSGINKVERFITISTPHKGTYLAYSLPWLGCIQMRPNSDFLKDLNQDVEILNQINFTSIWTAYDFIIIPAESSLLGIGKEIQLPILTHGMMIRSKKTLQAVTEALQESIKISFSSKDK